MANCYCNLRPAAPLFVSLRLPFSANLFSPVRQYTSAMALLAPAILDVRPIDGTPGIAGWLRGIGVRQVRLVCCLLMVSYIFFRFFNYSLGNFSHEPLDA